MTFEAAVVDEEESIIIYLDDGAFWIDDPRLVGQNDFPTLEEAAAAADVLVDQLWEERPFAIARSVGLDETAWTYKNFDGAHGFSRANYEDANIWFDGQTWRGSGGLGPLDTLTEAAAVFDGSKFAP